VNGIPKLVLRACALLCLAALAACVWAQTTRVSRPAASPPDRGPVLVELFTSEGCPHCPEADALLEKMYTEQSVEDAQIIALEEHVDYWDRQAWVDHFSSSLFTARQQSYADAMDLDSLYTPQMVVDGLVELVGNNESRARATISALGRAPLPSVRILQEPPGDADKALPAALRVRLEAHGLSPDSLADIYLVVGEDKLFSRVGGGRNSGETWPHSCIARRFQLLGKLPVGKGDFSMVSELAPPQPGWRLENLHLIAFVQEEDSRRILALGTAPLAGFLPGARGAGRPAAGTVPPHSSGAVPNFAGHSSNPVWATGSTSASQRRNQVSGVGD